MLPPSNASGSNWDRQSPVLPDLTRAFLKVDDVQYPAPTEIDSVDVLDDWLVKAEDALTEARNGVTAIAWPLALAGLVGFLAMLSDVVDAAGNVWTALTSSPLKFTVIIILCLTTILATALAAASSDARRQLTAIRHAYLRRRRDLQ